MSQKIDVVSEGRIIGEGVITSRGKIAFTIDDEYLLERIRLYGLNIEVPDKPFDGGVDDPIDRDPGLRVAGHTLLDDGAPFLSDGSKRDLVFNPGRSGHAKCICGEVSRDSFRSKYARRKWHREHKESLLPEPTLPDPGKPTR